MTEQTEQLISMFLQSPLSMTEQQSQELSSWITQDVENTKKFIEASLFNRCIHDLLLVSDQERNHILQDGMNAPDGNTESFDMQLWELLLKEEASAPEIEVAPPVHAERELIQHVKRKKIKHAVNKTSVITVMFAVAALVLVFVYIRLVPVTTNVEVATLNDSVNAQWAESAAPLSPNARLVTNHDPLMLRNGYAELVFDNNAKVVLEAPVEFQVISYDQIRLSYGRLYATVPKEALGFIVSTPTSKIIDLGTEFGVKTDFNGNTELHVVKGKASLVSGLDDDKVSILLKAGSAKKITAKAAESVDIPCDQEMFVRQVSSTNQFVWRGQNISLADIVGGGNGFGTGQLNQGVDPSTGRAIGTLSSTDVRPGVQGYIPSPSDQYIDGTFVPGIAGESTQLASNGIKTDEFPRTSGMLWGYIFSGAWHNGFDVPRHNLRLDGITFDGKTNPAVTMHSNLGITFDLFEIRKHLDGVAIKSFSSVFGVSETVNNRLKSRDLGDLDQSSEVLKLANERYSTAEFWVFLDGLKVFRQKISSISKAGAIDIPLDEDVRFLTLAVTEADDTCMFDWALWGRPELKLEKMD